MMMIIIIILLIAGFTLGYFIDLPFHLVDTKYLALFFLALLDSFTYGLVRDLSGQKAGNSPVFLRLVLGLVIGGFIIYFGEKSELDLYLVALLPLTLGFALNLYKFLPK